MSCGVGCRRRSDLALLWLWHRPAATALIRPLAWEPPYAAGAAQEMAKRPKKKKKEVEFEARQDSEQQTKSRRLLQIRGMEKIIRYTLNLNL